MGAQYLTEILKNKQYWIWLAAAEYQKVIVTSHLIWNKKNLELFKKIRETNSNNKTIQQSIFFLVTK